MRQLEELVVYQAEYDTEDFGPRPVWVRARALFEDRVDRNGEMIDRFELIG